MKDKELEKLKSKAAKWDALYIAIAKFYEEDEETGEPLNPYSDLGDIGEIAASHLGFL
jgi:hypothetical protein